MEKRFDECVCKKKKKSERKKSYLKFFYCQ